MAWMALFFALISLVLDGKPSHDIARIATLIALALIPCAAVGTLLGQPLRGLAVGVIVILVVLLVICYTLFLQYIFHGPK